MTLNEFKPKPGWLLQEVEKSVRFMEAYRRFLYDYNERETSKMTETNKALTPKAVAIVSGGLDSVTLTYDLKSKGFDVTMLSFNYGQRHKKELQYARIAADANGFEHHVIDLSGITSLISNSALTSGHKNDDGSQTIRSYEVEVPEGHYAEDSMKATVVPNRNMMMLSVAGAVAVNENANFVAIGVHGGDHHVYPDCRPQFIDAAAVALRRGNEGFGSFYDEWSASEVLVRESGFYGAIYAPYINKDKTFIAKRALELSVPLHLTWSCYRGEEMHCGRCGTCCERLEAIHDGVQKFVQEQNPDKITATNPNVYDKTEYEDTKFWQQVIHEGVKG